MLIIGGTGMLKAATEYFIEEALQITLLARNEVRLQYFKTKFPNAAIELIVQNYNDTEVFIDALKVSFDNNIPNKIICWMHSSGDASLLKLLDLLNSLEHPVEFYHILGSAGAKLPLNKWKFNKMEQVKYHQIILGFVLEKGNSRWLTHSEISNGVIEATKLQQDIYIVGTIEPWQSRP